LKAIRIVEWGKPLESKEISVPKPSGRGALVKVDAAGVCHTDVHLIEGSYDLGEGRKLSMGERGISLPITPGHEIAGRIESFGPDIGANRSRMKEGDSVVVYPWLGCGLCRKCRAGLENICEEKPQSLGIFQDGGYAEYVLVPDVRYLVQLEGKIDPVHAAPLACSGLTTYSAVRRSRISASELLIVIGAGGLGTTAIQIAKKTTGSQVVAVDVDDDKLKLAQEIGADTGINSKNLSRREIISKVRDLNNGLPADAAIDFVGTPTTSSLGFDLIGRGGRLVIVGLFGGEGKFALPIFPLKSVEIAGNFTGTLEDLADMVRLVSRGVITPVVSETSPLEGANDLIQRLVAGKIKGRAVLVP
jgi:alcohol dehydrogenase, propanol-preferring